MKKLLFYTLLVLILPLTLNASTVSFSPSSVSVTAGQMVSVAIYVNAGSDKAYTVKAAVSFPPELLEVRGFTFSSGWLPLSQPGYDSTNNTNGTLIKTAGYAGGLSGGATLGTVTFYAKQSGTAQVSVTGGTQVLSATNQNTFTGGSGVSVSISSVPVVAPLPPKPVPATPPKKAVAPKPTQTVTTPVVPTTSTTTSGSETEVDTATQTATVYSGNQFAEKNVSLWASLLAVLVSFGLGFLAARKQI